MKVTLAKQGGQAAGIRRPPRVVDAASLAESAVGELARLVAAAQAAPAIAERMPGRARDAMTYTITVQEGDAEPTVLSQSDTTMSASFAALLKWIERQPTEK